MLFLSFGIFFYTCFYEGSKTNHNTETETLLSLAISKFTN